MAPSAEEPKKHQAPHTPLITQGPKISGTDDRFGDMSKQEQMDVDHTAQASNQRFRRATAGLGGSLVG